MAVSAFLRAPWGFSLAVKVPFNAQHPSLSHPQRPRGNSRSFISRTRAWAWRAAGGSEEATLLLETADDDTDKADRSRIALEEGGVSESEVLSSEAWTARAEAHRAR